MIGRLLDLAHIDAGHLHLVRADTDVSALVARIAAAFKDAHAERELRVQTAGAMVASVDVGRLEQVVTNLIDNADKFSPPPRRD